MGFDINDIIRAGEFGMTQSTVTNPKLKKGISKATIQKERKPKERKSKRNKTKRKFTLKKNISKAKKNK